MKKVIKGQNYTVRLNLEKLSTLTDSKKVMTKATQNKLGNQVVREMKARIAAGKSPVKGVKPYAPYVKQREKRKSGKGYPDTSFIKKNFPNKKSRPVNLELSGAWLSKLTFRGVNGGITVGWFNPTKLEKALIETHNDGMHPHVPQRQVLPNKVGDDYTVSIRRIIKKVVLERIQRIINS